MTRLEYWIKAKTQYNIHSPFIFKLYNDVLFARTCGQLPPASIPSWAAAAPSTQTKDRQYLEMIYKMSDHFALRCVSSDPLQTLLQGDEPMGKVLVVNRPHADKSAEARWTQLLADPSFRVSIDLYDVGLLLANTNLHPQHFILR